MVTIQGFSFLVQVVGGEARVSELQWEASWLRIIPSTLKSWCCTHRVQFPNPWCKWVGKRFLAFSPNTVGGIKILNVSPLGHMEKEWLHIPHSTKDAGKLGSTLPGMYWGLCFLQRERTGWWYSAIHLFNPFQNFQYIVFYFILCRGMFGVNTQWYCM